MVVRIKLAFDQEEYSALLKLALSELRNPEGQLRFILRQELIRLGLFPKQGGNVARCDEQDSKCSDEGKFV